MCLEPPTYQSRVPVLASYASTRSLELTISSARSVVSTTNGVLYDMRPLPRSAFHRSFPVRLSTASRYDAGSWSHRRINVSWESVGERLCPQLISNGGG